MNKKKFLRIIAVSTACLSMGVLALGGCKKGGDGHVHTWTDKYFYDGAEGHYKKSTCIDHATVKGAIEAHDGDTCSKCGYVKGGSGETGVTAVEITGDTEVEIGGKIQLSAAITPAGASATVVWTVESGSQFADLDASGVLTGKAEGTVTVKAAAGSVSDTFSVNVVKASAETVHVTGVVLDKGTLDLKVGEADQTLTATVKPDNAKDKTYTWGSDNPNVATVSGGTVHAVAAGKANVTVTTSDGGHKATCVVTVKAADPGKDPTTPSKPVDPPDDPVIEGPVQGGVKITKPSEENKYTPQLETAYVEWEAAPNAKWYNVYYSPAGADSWTKLDAPLIRQYKADENHANNYYRADAIGLKAGEYDMKVVPVAANDTESTDYAASVKKMTVYAHERMGYAFTENCVPGAYNLDGTLKEGAQVVYVTADTAKTVTATVNGAKVTGFQTILDACQKGSSDPIAFRLVGKVSASDLDGMSSSGEGLQLKGKDGKTGMNVTIEGVGNDGSFKDFGILLRNCKNVEVRNLGILNCIDDGISVDTDNYHLWIHNNDIFYGKGGSGDKAKGDGALDTKKSSLITHSYNHFWDCGKCNLQGMTEKGDFKITYHHNWYDHSDSRHPRIRTATVHVFNNYFDGNAKYGVGVTMGASAFVENNYFRSTAQMKPMMSSQQGTDAAADKGTFSGESGGMIKAYGNVFDCSASNLKLMTQKDTAADNIDCYLASSRDEKVPSTYKTKVGGTTYNNFDTASDMYEYTVDTAEQARDKVMTYAGRVDGGDFKWTFDNAKEDPNYAVITELKSAILAYDDKILKIGS